MASEAKAILPLQGPDGVVIDQSISERYVYELFTDVRDIGDLPADDEALTASYLIYALKRARPSDAGIYSGNAVFSWQHRIILRAGRAIRTVTPFQGSASKNCII